MKLKHVTGAKLTLDSGEVVTLEKLGKGMFHTCYVDPTAKQVYSITIEREQGSDYSKEILSHCDENPHIPPVEYLGDIEERRVYRMPLYRPISAKRDKTAWDLFRRLEKAKEEAWRALVVSQFHKRERRVEDMGYEVNIRICDLIAVDPDVPQSLKDALWELTDTAAEYGSGYVMEFAKRNVMVDEAGTLILLDVLFSLETASAVWNARAKRAERVW